MVLQKKYNKEISSCKARETKLNMELRKYTGQLDKLNAEIADSLTGDSVYSPKQLSAAINGITAKIDETKLLLETVRNEVTGKKASMEKVKPAYERFSGWAEEFMVYFKYVREVWEPLNIQPNFSKGTVLIPARTPRRGNGFNLP